MSDHPQPRTNAGQALAAWNRRSSAMAETIARIEGEAVSDWLASEDAEQRLEAALATNVECSPDGPMYDVRRILAELARR